jgi:sigma-B regulation protein RsbU (phosphoserine phosphatase)
LAAKGFEVLHAQDGTQAIERIEADAPDLVLLDVMMPRKTGYDVLEEVRPTLEAAELPVLLLTAKAQESDLAHGFSLGASDYLLKPVSFVELDARLGHHARLLRAVRALSATLAGLETTVADRTAELRKALDLLDVDLQEAKRFQDVAMRVPPRVGAFDVAARSNPCGAVGGDFFDVFPRGPGKLRLLMADATGHGVQAALRTMVIKTAYDAIKGTAASPADCLAELNAALVRAYPDLEAKTDATCIDVELGADERLRIDVSTAGAMTALVGEGTGAAHELRTRGAALGVDAEMAYAGVARTFARDARLCVFSDGISEQSDEHGRAFDVDRVEDLVREPRSPQELVEGIFASWSTFRGSASVEDDASVVVVRLAADAASE